jgi:hypothetical protein
MAFAYVRLGMDRSGSHVFLNPGFSKTLRILHVFFGTVVCGVERGVAGLVCDLGCRHGKFFIFSELRGFPCLASGILASGIVASGIVASGIVASGIVVSGIVAGAGRLILSPAASSIGILRGTG